jgi:UDP:flavonoid glycosyltransferase YjiC (YdhE family)
VANVIVYSMAYRGDVYPFVPIAQELYNRGHDVTMVTPREYHKEFASQGFECRHSGTDFGPELLNSPRYARYIRRWGMRLKGARLGRLFYGELTAKDLDPLYDTLREAVTDTRADLIVTHPGAAIVASMVAESVDIAWVTGDLFPMLRPSSFYSPPGLPNLGRKANRRLWDIAGSRLIDRMSYASQFAKFRARKGLNAERQNPFDYGDSPYLNIGLNSPHYFRPAPDWPDNCIPVGFSLWEGADGGELAADVSAFLAAGEPPVVVCLGTSAASARPEIFAAVRRSLIELGQRGLYLTSVEGIAEALPSDDERHLAVPFAPLRAVLPKVKAIVHSGAAGTNAMALAAGVPSVVVPALFDQLWHAERQEELGTGVHVSKLSQLSDAVSIAVSDENIADNARRFAALIADEQGPVLAADLIENLIATELA